MSPYTTIVAETHQRVGLIRLDRPRAFNALNSTILAELNTALKDYDLDPGIGAMVITGNERVFEIGRAHV